MQALFLWFLGQHITETIAIVIFLFTYFGVAVGGIPGLALASTYAGNLITVGSIANLITIEQAKNHGVNITFREHARVGVPVTRISLAITMLWIKLKSGAF